MLLLLVKVVGVFNREKLMKKTYMKPLTTRYSLVDEGLFGIDDYAHCLEETNQCLDPPENW